MTVALPLHRLGSPAPALRVVPAPEAPPVPEFPALLLMIDFRTTDGHEWSAVGGGESVAEAVEVARRALPLGRDWQLAGWNELYGD